MFLSVFTQLDPPDINTVNAEKVEKSLRSPGEFHYLLDKRPLCCPLKNYMTATNEFTLSITCSDKFKNVHKKQRQ